MSDTNPLPTGWVQQPSGLAHQETINRLSPHHGNVGKPVRRRSRASRRTPATLLNATTANFRALVQQFTGCHPSASSSQRAPLNIDFSFGSEQNAPMVVAPFGSDYHQQQQLQRQQQEYMFPLRDYTSDQKPNMHATLDDYVIENVSLQELIEGSSVNGSNHSSYFF